MVGARSLAMALNRLIDMGIDAREPAHRVARAAVGRADRRRGARVLRRLARRVPGRGLAARPGRALAVADPGRGVRDLPVPQALHVALPPLARRRRSGSRRSAAGSRSRASCRGRRGCSARAVATWVAGFDLFYSLFDVEIDREQGLHSWATRFGERGVFVGARVLHVADGASASPPSGLGLDVGRVVLARRAGGRAAARLRAHARAARATCAASTPRSSR